MGLSMDFIGSHTMFDFSRFYDMIADVLPSDCRIAEVGVADGASALYLAKKLHEKGKKFKLFMIDSLDYGHSEQLGTIMRNVLNSGLGEHIEIIPIDSLNASLKFNDQSLHFVFVDASHTFEGTKADIRLWWQKILDGCYLSGHDYLKDSIGVTNAVDELIPKEYMEVYDTEKGYGVWAVKKDLINNFKI